MNDIVKGQIVFSKAGRDKNHYFIVIDYQTPYVYLVDGKTRRLETPKKKKDKHIQVTHYVDVELQEALLNETHINNADIRKSLSQFIIEDNHEQ
jgi:ribosomal protein L14E/L6E/L27E